MTTENLSVIKAEIEKSSAYKNLTALFAHLQMRGLGQINKDCFKDPNCWITLCPGTRGHGLGSTQN